MVISTVQSSSKPHEGATVLLVDPILSRNELRLARIVEAQAGADGVIREAKPSTATGGTISRPTNLIIPLEIYSDCDEAQPQDLREN